MSLNFKANETVILAPAAGVTDSITRQIAKKSGADICVSELVSSEGLIRDHLRTQELLEFTEIERPIGLQLFGADPVHMAQAAKYAESLNPDFIDLNFGCPAKKVVGKNGGSSLLLNLPVLARIIENVVKAVSLPVTMKYRSGWDSENIVAVEVAKIAESSGITAICLHPRTRVQGFSGEADWSHIAAVKQAVGISVIGSGDIDSPVKAKAMFNETGCDAIMVCRASFGNPWIFGRIKHYLKTSMLLPEPDANIRIQMAIEHLKMSVNSYGPIRGVLRMRNQLSWYLSGLPGAAQVRSKMMLIPSEAEVCQLLHEYNRKLSANEDLLTNVNPDKIL
jgi:tRNA-dihydrouridine synthase B